MSGVRSSFVTPYLSTLRFQITGGPNVAEYFSRKGKGNKMKNNFRTNIGGALLTLALILGISAATSTTAEAQYRNDRIDRNDQNQRRDRDRTDSHDQNRDWNRGRHHNRNRNIDRYDRNNGNNGNYGRGGYGNNGGYNNQNQIQVNQGFQAGLNTGASDAQRGQNFNPQRSHYYQNASSQAFRQGFLQGYNQGYQQYGGYGNRRNGNRNSNGTGNILGSIFGRP
jgi:hypothetical protein